MNGPEVVLVDKDSATAGRHWENEPHHILSVNTNHSDIVKFGDNDEDYVRVRSQLRRIVNESEGIIRNRFPRVTANSLRNLTWRSGSDTADSTIYVDDAGSPTLTGTQGQTSSLNLVVDRSDNKSASRHKIYGPRSHFANALHYRICFLRRLWIWLTDLSTGARVTLSICIIVAMCIITALTIGIVIPTASPKPR